jgi:hypothetical protein
MGPAAQSADGQSCVLAQKRNQPSCAEGDPSGDRAAQAGLRCSSIGDRCPQEAGAPVEGRAGECATKREAIVSRATIVTRTEPPLPSFHSEGSQGQARCICEGLRPASWRLYAVCLQVGRRQGNAARQHARQDRARLATREARGDGQAQCVATQSFRLMVVARSGATGSSGQHPIGASLRLDLPGEPGMGSGDRR